MATRRKGKRTWVGKVSLWVVGGEYAKKRGLGLGFNARCVGMRCQHLSMIVDDGVVKTLCIAGPGRHELSGADKMVEQF